jgi:hypothetical protein
LQDYSLSVEKAELAPPGLGGLFLALTLFQKSVTPTPSTTLNAHAFLQKPHAYTMVPPPHYL